MWARRLSAAGFKILEPPVRGEEERLLYWNCEIEASRRAEMRCFLAGYSLMGPQRASRLRRGVGVQALLALVLCASQLLCLHLLAPAAPAAHAVPAVPAATSLAGWAESPLAVLPASLAFFFFLLACFLCRCPCSSPPSHSKIRSNNRHAVVP